MSVTSTHQVGGMTCDHCVRSVRQEVSAIPGVTEVEVDLGSGKVTVTSESDLDSDALGHAIDEAGYTLIQ